MEIKKIHINFLALVIDLLFILGVIFVGVGFYKLLYYVNSETASDANINAFVGGEAYNYIINANQATALFVFAGGCAMVATLLKIYQVIKTNKNKV